MNPARVEKRRMAFDTYHGGVLEDYQLVFNKRSVIYPGAASANVMAHEGHAVEGVVYRLSDVSQIQVMDPFEGHPVRYSRKPLPIICEGDIVHAWVYIANAEYIKEGLKPARWYLEHLLAGRSHLSNEYYNRLSKTDCLPDSEVEPAW